MHAHVHASATRMQKANSGGCEAKSERRQGGGEEREQRCARSWRAQTYIREDSAGLRTSLSVASTSAKAACLSEIHSPPSEPPGEPVDEDEGASVESGEAARGSSHSMRIWPWRSRAVMRASQKKLLPPSRAHTRIPSIAAHLAHFHVPTENEGGGAAGAAGGGGTVSALGFRGGLGATTIWGLGSSHTLHFFTAAALINVQRGQPHL